MFNIQIGRYTPPLSYNIVKLKTIKSIGFTFSILINCLLFLLLICKDKTLRCFLSYGVDLSCISPRPRILKKMLIYSDQLITPDCITFVLLSSCFLFTDELENYILLSLGISTRKNTCRIYLSRPLFDIRACSI